MSNTKQQVKPELFEVLEALCDMWNQYCGGVWGHDFMSAGENCADVLDKYKLLKNDKGTGGEVDWDRLQELKIAAPQPKEDVKEDWKTEFADWAKFLDVVLTDRITMYFERYVIQPLQSALAEKDKQVEKLKRLIESLTPGGSEFVNNPEYCIRFAIEQRNTIPSQILPFKRKAEQLQAENAELKNEVERLREIEEAT